MHSAEGVLRALAAEVEAENSHTTAHTERVALVARHLAMRLRLRDEDEDIAWRGGKMHDIGKLGIPHTILHKRGPLAADEWAVMRQHPLIGENMVRPLKTAQGLLPIIRHHHERWDGTGYPDGLQGEQIPLLARIVATCDAYDSMVSDRPYRPGRPHPTAVAILKSGRGSQWDPHVVDILIEEVPALAGLWAA
jgi:putative nucleotidyltransferase with HDIG domain